MKRGSNKKKLKKRRHNLSLKTNLDNFGLRTSFLLFLGILFCIYGSAKGQTQHLSFQREIEDRDLVVRKFLSNSFNKELIVLKNQTIDMYDYVKSFSFIRAVEHGMDLKNNYVGAGIDKGGEVFIFSQKEAQYYDDQNKLKLIAKISLSQIPEMESFSAMMDFNNYDLKFLMKDGSKQKLLEWDYRSRGTRITEVLAPKKKAQTLDYISYLDYGFKIGIFYGDNSIVVFDSNSHTVAYEINDFVKNGKNLVKRFSYSSKSNELVVQFGDHDFYFYNAQTGKSRGRLTVKERIKQIYTPRGTQVLILNAEAKLIFIDLHSFQIVHEEPSPKGVWFGYMSGTSFFYTAEEVDKSNRVFKFYSFDKKNPIFCHISCKGECKFNFKSCDEVREFFFVYLYCFLGCFVFLYLSCQVERIFRCFGDKGESDDSSNLLRRNYEGKTLSGDIELGKVEEETDLEEK